jgi:hypothetical protein
VISGGPGGGAPAGPNQLVRGVGQGLQPQLFSQIQFSQSGQNNALGFPDQTAATHLQLLQQQQHQQQNFQNLQNVNFLSEQLAAAGVGQMISQAASVSSQNSQQNMNMPNISMQNLMTPMALTTLSFPSIQVAQSQSNAQQQQQQQQQQSSAAQKQRVFTGTVTKTHDNFGFIDDEVFFQTG